MRAPLPSFCRTSDWWILALNSQCQRTFRGVVYGKMSLTVLVTQSYLTLCDPMDCSLPGSFVYGTLQTRILEWLALPLSRRSSQLRDWTWVSRIAGGFFTVWATKETHKMSWGKSKYSEPRESLAVKALRTPSFPALQSFESCRLPHEGTLADAIAARPRERHWREAAYP